MPADLEPDKNLEAFALRMGDNTLILGQQVSAWCGHAPVLEEDIALANVALDLIGQTRMWLGLAADLQGEGKSADDIAFLRDAREYKNCLLVEQPNGDFAHTLMRQYLFDAWHLPMLTALKSSSDSRIADIAEKSAKEATYHLERSENLVISLGDGNQESHDRMQAALETLWPFTGELTRGDTLDQDLASAGVAPDLAAIKTRYENHLSATLDAATLIAPEDVGMRKGGKSGIHSEGLGFILADMQWLQRAYPGATW